MEMIYLETKLRQQQSKQQSKALIPKYKAIRLLDKVQYL